MTISLKKASLDDAELIWRMQIASFKTLLDKYQDYDSSPGTETLDRVIHRMQQSDAEHWIILLNNIPIGAIGIGYHADSCKLKRIFILPKHQGNGFAQQAVHLIEAQHPETVYWGLVTILQEKKLCHLYEKLGYQKTGQIKPVKEGMDLVFYTKKTL